MDSLIPNPCLIAIILTISTHNGPQFVLHYPPNPDNHDFKATSLKAPRKGLNAFKGKSLSTLSASSSSSSTSDSDSTGIDSNYSSSSDEYTDSNDLGKSPQSYSTQSSSAKLDSGGYSKNPGYRDKFNIDPHKNKSLKIHPPMLPQINRLAKSQRSPLSPFLKKVLEESSSHEKGPNRENDESMYHNFVDTSNLTVEANGIDPTVKIPDITSENELYCRKGQFNSSSLSHIGDGTFNLDHNDPSSSTAPHRVNSANDVSGSGGNNGNKSTNGSNRPHVLGFDTTYLSEILAPPEGMCNSKFELTIDNMVFLGKPVHVREDGRWCRHLEIKPQSKKNMDKYNENDSESNTKPPYVSSNKKGKRHPRSIDNHINENETTSGHDSDVGNDADDENDLLSNNRENDLQLPLTEGSETRKDVQKTTKDHLRMFHVTFVVNPPVREYHERIEQMYYYIVKKFTRMLRFEQARFNYISKEVTTILEVRDDFINKGCYSHLEFWNKVIKLSSLARSIKEIYHSVSQSEIARFNLPNMPTAQSLQVPIITQIDSLPNVNQKVFMGTDISTLPSLNILYHERDPKAQNYAILLLDNPENIITELRLNGHKADLVKMFTSHDSIRQIASKNIKDNTFELMELAVELVDNRKAKPIFPISSKNIYIISPLAPISELHKFSRLFSENFSSLVTLPRFLELISSERPRKFIEIIKSIDKSQRRKITEALAWTIKYGFVTLMQTFLFLRIPKEIKLTVNSEIQRQEKALKQQSTSKRANSEALDNSDHDKEPHVLNHDVSTKQSFSGLTSAFSNSLHFDRKPISTHVTHENSPSNNDNFNFTESDLGDSQKTPDESLEMGHELQSPAIGIPNTVPTIISLSGGASKAGDAKSDSTISLRIPKPKIPSFDPSSLSRSGLSNQFIQGISNSFPVDRYMQVSAGNGSLSSLGRQVTGPSTFLSPGKGGISEISQGKPKSENEFSVGSVTLGEIYEKSEHPYQVKAGHLNSTTTSDKNESSYTRLSSAFENAGPSRTVPATATDEGIANSYVNTFKSPIQATPKLIRESPLKHLGDSSLAGIRAGGDSIGNSFGNRRTKSYRHGTSKTNVIEVSSEILLDPDKATALQMKWISQIQQEIQKELPEDKSKLFSKLVKYMDGKTPMEWVLVDENVSHKDFQLLLKALENYVIIVYHW